MTRGPRVGIVIPAYNEEASITATVADFRASPLVDEIVVVDNNCRDATAELAERAGARVIAESRPGYGSALRAGIAASRGDVIVLVEADGSFRAADLPKLLEHSGKADLVLGTRTRAEFVAKGANMGPLLRWGNAMSAKLLAALWGFPGGLSLSDVGCTYRLFSRAAWVKMKPGLREDGPGFSPEMICEALRLRLRVHEVPVGYHARMGGESAHSGRWTAVLRTALRMYRCILRKRFSPAPNTGR